jgi:UDP-N-acetylglucosamine--dolichyl-phosphate N-acetylglucosaminephosphotransferase
MTSRIFNPSPTKLKPALTGWKDKKDPLVLSEVSEALVPSDFEKVFEESVTVMASSWLEQRFSKTLWFALLAAPLAVSYYTRNILGVSMTLAVLAGLCTHAVVPDLGRLLLAADRCGKDLNKKGQPKLAESLGVAAGSVYLITMFLFIPCAEATVETLGNYTAALLSISSMLLLGFADDVLNLKWRQKILLPAMAALPLLMIYKLTSDRTEVVVPLPLRALMLGKSIVNIGGLYYVYMAAVAIFCTHSINILAGVNGVEVGQSLVIGIFIILNNILCIARQDTDSASLHYFSLFLMIPFVSVSAALLHHNWYPARVFVGDTFCYFAGMTFAVSGILGHFSKTLLLLFIPQIFNFLISMPQLFGILPCPRHRLPRQNPETSELEASNFVVIDFRRLKPIGRLCLRIFDRFHIIKIIKKPTNENPSMICTNLTLLSLLLNWFGPMREDRLALLLMLVQFISCSFGLLIRHFISKFVF